MPGAWAGAVAAAWACLARAMETAAGWSRPSADIHPVSVKWSSANSLALHEELKRTLARLRGGHQFWTSGLRSNVLTQHGVSEPKRYSVVWTLSKSVIFKKAEIGVRNVLLGRHPIVYP